MAMLSRILSSAAHRPWTPVIKPFQEVALKGAQPLSRALFTGLSHSSRPPILWQRANPSHEVPLSLRARHFSSKFPFMSLEYCRNLVDVTRCSLRLGSMPTLETLESCWKLCQIYQLASLEHLEIEYYYCIYLMQAGRFEEVFEIIDQRKEHVEEFQKEENDPILAAFMNLEGICCIFKALTFCQNYEDILAQEQFDWNLDIARTLFNISVKLDGTKEIYATHAGLVDELSFDCSYKGLERTLRVPKGHPFAPLCFSKPAAPPF